MYIRRKVFSTVIDENGEERYFSTNEIINEEDYLEEVMYSGEPPNEELVKDLNNRKYKRNNTIGYGVAGAGLGAAAGAAAALRGKNAGMGALKGAAVGAAALGTLGYLRGRYKANKRENRRTAVLNKMQ